MMQPKSFYLIAERFVLNRVYGLNQASIQSSKQTSKQASKMIRVLLLCRQIDGGVVDALSHQYP